MEQEWQADAQTRQWLLESRHGTLGTLSVDEETAGWPFLSIAPYALTGAGEPFFLVARIAQHTRNMSGDGRASLLIQQASVDGDPQKGWRVTVLGQAERVVEPGGEAGQGERAVTEAEFEELEARYLEVVPQAAAYRETHGFDYWVLRPTRARVIAGFGRIAWLPASAVARDPAGGSLKEAAAGIISHMNEDHKDALQVMVEAQTGSKPQEVAMTHLDEAGFLVRASGELHYLPYGREIGPDDARTVFVEMTKKARAAVGAKTD